MIAYGTLAFIILLASTAEKRKTPFSWTDVFGRRGILLWYFYDYILKTFEKILTMEAFNEYALVVIKLVSEYL